MTFPEKLRELRASAGLSQSQLAAQLHVSRQAVTKWESGQALPDLDRAVALSRLYHISLDGLFLPLEECSRRAGPEAGMNAREALIGFLLRAKRQTYAAGEGMVEPSRTAAHDAAFAEGDYRYLDTYLGGACFAGEEVVWIKETPVWAMSYCGRVTGEGFSGDFLKQALLKGSMEYPYRGPLCYQQGPQTYHMTIQGGFGWSQGMEEIFVEGRRVYECVFHGGSLA